MSGLLSIGRYILVAFLTEWTNLKEFVYLDSALCNHEIRPKLLSLIASFRTVFQDNLFKLIYCRFSHSMLNWNKNRNLSVTKLHFDCQGTGDDVDTLNLLREVSSVKTLALVSCSRNAATSVIETIGDSLQEVFIVNVEASRRIIESLSSHCNITKCTISNDLFFTDEAVVQLCRRYGSSLRWVGIDVLPSFSGVCTLLTQCRSLQTLELMRSESKLNCRPMEMYLMHSPISMTECMYNYWTYKSLRLYLYRVNSSISELKLDMAERVDDSLLGEIAALCPRLRSLSFPADCSEVSDFGLIQLVSQVTELKSLLLEGVTGISDVSVAAVSVFCKQLTHFSLRHAKLVTVVGLTTLTSYGHRLRSLSLKNMSLTGPVVLSLLLHCSRLEEIFLAGNILLTAVDLVCAASLMRSVERLHIQEIPDVNDAVLCALAEHCRDLTSLHVGHYRCTVDDSGLLAVLTNCSKIRSLSLTYCYHLTAQSLLNILQWCPDLHLLFIRIKGPVEMLLLQQVVTDMKKLVLLSFCGILQNREIEKFIAESRPSLCYYPF